MDYLEGLFLGKLWSDTDFENRRHVTLFILYGLFVDAMVFFTYWTGKRIPVLESWGTAQMVIFIALCVLCPFICFRYYRMPLWGKLLVLLEKAYKHVLIIAFTINFCLPYLSVQSGDLQSFLITYLNETLEESTQSYLESSGTFATILGVVSGGIKIVGVVVFWALVSVVLPGLMYLIYRIVQYGFDWVIGRLVIRKFFVKRK